MMFSRVLGSIGRFLITSGIVVLLFVAYQLWGTGLQEAQAQNELNDDFDELLAAFDDDPTTTLASADSTDVQSTTSTTPATTTTTTTTTVPEFGPIDVDDEELAAALYRDGGEAIARIDIPAIGLQKVVVEGVRVEDLRNGPGHYRATSLPGQPGNTGIAGHRTTYGAPFNRIDELVPGDEFTVETVQGVHRYRVLPARIAFDPAKNPTQDPEFVVPVEDGNLGHIIVRPNATWVLGDYGDDRITLTACHPKRSASRRIIVAAALISEPVAAPPPPAEYLAEGEGDLVGEQVDESEATGGGRTPGSIDPSGAADGAAPGADDAAAVFDRSVFADEVSLDEGLDGDEGALLPALLWGGAAIAVYQVFKLLARRWRFWPAVALGIVPVVVLMALSFEKVDRFLPAG